MAHSRGDVLKTRNELLRLIGEQRDIYAGAIACLDNTKRMLLMVGVDGDVQEEVVELTEMAVPHSKRGIIKDLAEKMGG